MRGRVLGQVCSSGHPSDQGTGTYVSGSPLASVEELTLPGPLPRVPWKMSKRGYHRGAHFSPLTLKSLDGWGCFAVEMQSLEIKFLMCAPTQPQRCPACFSEHEDAAVPSLLPLKHVSPEQDNARCEFCCIYHLQKKGPQIKNTSHLQAHISPAREGPLEGVGFLKKDAAAQDNSAWTRRDDTGWGEASVTSRTGAEAGHSTARIDGSEGLCGDVGCPSSLLE